MGDPSGADILTVVHGRPHDGTGGCTLKEAAAHGEPMLEQVPGNSCGL